MKSRYILAIDQGTTSSRAILYDLSGGPARTHSQALPVRFPQDGWVEQQGEEIWETVRASIAHVTDGVAAKEIAAIGITNQRETVLAWDKKTGAALTPAIVWQCRRTAEICELLRKEGLSELVRDKTGLVIDSYFSSTKIRWLMENTAGLKARVEKGEVVFGTMDAWTLFRLTKDAGQAVMATEPSNASRTMLVDLKTGRFDPELLKLFELTENNLPQILPSIGKFGAAKINGGEVPIMAMLGDQQASLFGHGCLEPESAKCTFGTGAFLLLNTGEEIRHSASGLLTTIAWEMNGKRTYAVEGSIFIAGSLIQWLRDGLKIISSSAESETFAAAVPDSGGVVLVPAFVGLGAPYWDESARGTIFGLTRDTKREHIVRAALEAVAHQVADVLETSEFSALKDLRIDGGMSANKLFCEILSGLNARPVLVSPLQETTAFGAAAAAAIGAGVVSSVSEFLEKTGLKAGERKISSTLAKDQQQAARARWKEAITRTLKWL